LLVVVLHAAISPGITTPQLVSANSTVNISLSGASIAEDAIVYVCDFAVPVLQRSTSELVIQVTNTHETNCTVVAVSETQGNATWPPLQLLPGALLHLYFSSLQKICSHSC
jgi:hypothetical protein